jgi:RNA polymerase sigma factor (sigma-70 family)
MDDLALLQQYATNGNDSAFTQLVERYVGMVFGTALRRTGNRELAEEIAQNVFAILARKASKLKPGTIVSGWLHRTAVLQSAQAMRTEQRRTTRMKEFSETLAAAEVSAPHDPQAWNDAVRIMDESMNQLAPVDRDVLFLRFCEERNFREIGEAVGKSESATLRHVNRALEKLSGLLRKKGVVVPAATLAAGLTLELGKAATAPAGLTASVAKFALSGSIAGAGTAGSATLLTTLTIMITHIKTSTLILAGCALIALFTGDGILFRHLNEKESAKPVGAEIARQEQALATKPSPTPAAKPTSNAISNMPIEATTGPDKVAQLLALAIALAKQEHEPKAAQSAIRQLLANLGADEMADALAIVSSSSESKEIREFMEKEIFRRWGSLDPTTAMKLALETKSSSALTHNVGAVTKSWAENDPKSAFAWYQSAQSDSERPLGSGVLQKVIADLMEGWVRHDVDGGFQMIESFDFDEQTAARASLDDFADDDALRDEVSARILKIQDQELMASVVHDFGAKWAKTDPRATATWFDQIEFDDPTTAFSAGNRIGERFFHQFPREAVDWFYPKVPAEMKEHFVRGLVGEGWAQRDREAAVSWLQENGFNPDEIIQQQP